MKKKLFLIGCVITMVLLALLLKDLAREAIVIPILKVFRTFDFFPQILLWFSFVLAMFLIACKSLTRWSLPVSGIPSRKKNFEGRIEVLAGLIRKSHKGIYYKRRLSQYLGKLTLETLACRERQTAEIMKERLRSGTLDVPPEILAYLQAGIQWGSAYSGRRKKGARLVDQGSPLDLDYERVVEFLEHEMEDFYGIEKH
jgi:hypothetical protein